MIRIQLEGLPPSASTLRGMTIREKIHTESAYHADVFDQVGRAYTEPAVGTSERRVRVEIAYIFGPKSRLSDPVSNREKMLLDALQSSGIIANDRFVRIAEIVGVNGPRDETLVKIFDFTEATIDQVRAWFEDASPQMERHIPHVRSQSDLLLRSRAARPDGDSSAQAQDTAPRPKGRQKPDHAGGARKPARATRRRGRRARRAPRRV